MDGVTIYNDGLIAVQLFLEGDEVHVGTIDGQMNGSTPEQFLADMPVTTAFLDEMRKDPDNWQMVQDTIREGLASRGRKAA